MISSDSNKLSPVGPGYLAFEKHVHGLSQGQLEKEARKENPESEDAARMIEVATLIEYARLAIEIQLKLGSHNSNEKFTKSVQAYQNWNSDSTSLPSSLAKEIYLSHEEIMSESEKKALQNSFKPGFINKIRDLFKRVFGGVTAEVQALELAHSFRLAHVRVKAVLVQTQYVKKLSTLEIDLQTVRDNLEQKERINSALRSEKEKLENILENLTTGSGETKEMIRGLNQQLSDIRKTLERTQKKLQESRSKIESLEREIAGLKTQHELEKAELVRKNNELKDNHDRILQELNDILNKSLEGNQQDSSLGLEESLRLNIQRARNVLSETKSSVEMLNEQLQKAQESLASAKEDTATEKSRVVELETEVQRLQMQLRAIDNTTDHQQPVVGVEKRSALCESDSIAASSNQELGSSLVTIPDSAPVRNKKTESKCKKLLGYCTQTESKDFSAEMKKQVKLVVKRMRDLIKTIDDNNYQEVLSDIKKQLEELNKFCSQEDRKLYDSSLRSFNFTFYS